MARLFLLLAILAATLMPGCLLHAQEGRQGASIIMISSDRALSRYLDEGPLPGDIVVLEAGQYERPQTFNVEPEAGLPVIIIGRHAFDHLTEKLGRPGSNPEEIRQLSERFFALPASPIGAEIDHDLLTDVSIENWQFEGGDWFISGLNIEAAPRRGYLLIFKGAANSHDRVTFTHNRLSNCDPSPEDCRWEKRDRHGKKDNGGYLITVGSEVEVVRIENNTFERLRGYLLILVKNGNQGTVISGNSFRDLRPWADNVGEAILLGSVPTVDDKDSPPVFSPLGAVIERNLFEHANAEYELISVKSAKNRIVGNRIINSKAHLSLRDGEETIVEDNEIFRSAGIRVMGERQVIRRNRIVYPLGNRALWFENGAHQAGYVCYAENETSEAPLSWRYRAAKDPVVVENRIIVSPGGADTAISRSKEDRHCYWSACGRTPVPLPCGDILSDETFHSILTENGNQIMPLRALPSTEIPVDR